MDRRYIKYRRNKFKKWKDRVKKHLPSRVIKFYSFPKHIDYEKHKLLGGVIKDISDPYYVFLHTGDDYNNEMAMEILLEIRVRDLFSFISKLKNL